VRSPAPPTFCSITTWRNRWRVPRLGLSRAAAPAQFKRHRGCAREAGAEIRTQAAIAKIIVKDGKARGVVLANGDEIYTETISPASIRG